ncbi:MAG: dipeptidase [Methyloligellaceae bacterium]
MTDILGPVLQKLDDTTDEALERVFELMRIPSISTNPAHHDDCVKAANYCADMLKETGFETSVMETTGEPMVVGQYVPDGGQSGPHVLFYGHYDVQPVDPLDLWDAPPFEPGIVEDKLHGPVIMGRGSSDDKGQLMTFLEACRAWMDVHGSLPLRITVLFEGEEECGSPSLPAFLEEHSDKLKADLALVCDTGQWDAKTPAITTMLRGLASIEVVISGPNRDLHSGLYGGPVRNPIRVLTHILGDLYDDQGSIQIPGFYDEVMQTSEEQLEQWRNIGFDAQTFLGGVGLSEAAGEKKYNALEQLWARPALEINGIHGGYTGPGSKTVIPESAFAKLSFRLVANQDPDKVLEGVKKFVTERLPSDCTAEFKGEHGAPAVKFDQNSASMKASAEALTEEFGVQAIMMGCGASIPIVEPFKNELGMDTLLIGFALEDDRIHAPNEKYNLSSFKHGRRAWARIMDKLARL